MTDQIPTDSYDYDDNFTPASNGKPQELSDNSQKAGIMLANVVIFLLGICGNGVVIWIAGLKMKKTVNTTWYLSLAFSDFIFCACLPLNIIHIATKEWIFGLFMCKFTSFVMFLNMFSSIFILVVISVDRYLLVVFPVWAQNHRCLRKASVVVVVVWAISVALSIPSTIFRKVTESNGMQVCFNHYPTQNSHLTLVVSRFVFSFVLPLLIIIFCYSFIIIRLRTIQLNRSSKPIRVMTAVIIIFFLSWLPYHVFILLDYGVKSTSFIRDGIKISVTFASANSCLNPFLYAFMGKGFKPKCWSSFLFKIKNTFDEDEGYTGSRGTTLSLADSKVSTNV
ncbi:C3a anaphylatoxin chemotactic receptor-like [Esox lucius]|uniref:G-protein coupled receptors family 1 profile domain-containing protein n=1 Tax=Esox lucius TaxID=8010 RepID=A0A3P8Y8E7_ESOLU|nr:C3a anaphylatoxin chemotactic receptor-like [Esox lucius]XP_019907722.1 C3a anaphylatoxin chemotactic receptor-like [Esox lucius]